MKSRRKPAMPDPRLPLRSLLEAMPGLAWLILLGLVAWAWRPESTAELVGRIEREVAAMEVATKGGE
jgi:hypothetical protein